MITHNKQEFYLFFLFMGFCRVLALLMVNSVNLSLSSVVTLEWICKNKRAAGSAMLHGGGKIIMFLFYCSAIELTDEILTKKYFLLEKCTAEPVRNLAQHNVLRPFFFALKFSQEFILKS